MPSASPSASDPSEDAGSDAPGAARVIDAVVLVVDVSGSTALSVALEADHGPRAADRLAGLMDRLLGTFATLVEAEGGTVFDVVGDSVQALWPVEFADGAAAESAGRAALAMTAHIAKAMQDGRTGGHEDRLSARVGIGAGTLTLAPIGGYLDDWSPFVWGPALLDAAVTTTHAAVGAVAVHRDAWGQFEGLFEGRQLRGGSWELIGARTGITARALSGPRPIVAENGAAAWAAELRSASILFVRLFRAEELADATPAHVNTRVALVQAATIANGGQLDRVHADEKGIAAVVAFGLPPTPIADAAPRALITAIELRRHLGDRGVDVAIGVATGKVRAGIGGAHPEVYTTIYGGAANLAARCMQACRDEILVDTATRRLGGDQFEFFAPEGHALKGFDASVAIFGVGNIRRRHEIAALSDTTPLAGRERDVAYIEAFLDAPTGARLLMLEGEVGVGKSRLAAHASTIAARRGDALLVCRAGPLSGHTPLFAWRNPAASLLRDWARRHNVSVGEAQASVLETVGEDRGLAPLLDPLFGHDAARKADERLLGDPEGRPRLARRLQSAVLAELLAPGGRLVVIDDAHWLDDASAQLAADVLDAHPNVRVVLVGRTPLKTPPQLLAAADGPASIARYTIDSLDRRGTAELAAGLLGPIDDLHPLVDWVQARARGNPLFSRELLSALPPELVGAGLATPGAWRDVEARLLELDLPQTIEDAAAARLGAQPFGRLGILKAASVIGGQFDMAMLVALGVPVAADALDGELAGLVDEGLLVADWQDERPVWRFGHAMVGEIVYGSLPERTRTDLHRKAVEYLEAQPAVVVRAASAQIAYHWIRAGVPERAMRPLRRAGSDANRAGAYAAALGHFETALAIATDDTDRAVAEPLRRAQLHLDVSNAHIMLSDHHKAVAPAIASLDGLWSGKPKHQLGWALMAAREAAGLTLTIALPTLYARRRRSTRHRARNRLRCEAAQRLSDCFFNLQGTLPAVACALFAARSAEASGDLSISAEPYGMLGYVAGLSRLEGVARFLGNRALADCERKQNYRGLYRILFSKMFLAVSLGRWAEVHQLAREAQGLDARYQSTRDQGLTLVNIGIAQQWSSDFRGMKTTFEALGALGVARSDDKFIDWSELSLGRIALYEGHLDEAEARFNRSHVMAGRIAEVQAVLIADCLHGVALLRQGRIDDVAPLAAGLLAQAQAAPMQMASGDAFAGLAEIMNGLLAHDGSAANRANALAAQKLLKRYAAIFPTTRPLAALHGGQLAALGGKHRRAEAMWRKGLTAARSMAMPYDAARLHGALATLPSSTAGARSADAARAAELAAACGAVSVPALPVTTRGD
ncbi:AAA family ATPase [Sphingosinicellaceae bacterium]|nr:AAA family ATPase [Sphingosinicellaceae bacterium]